ncbi:MAG: ABC transporter substrate-binding protein [Acidimicrobiales bacterium]
MSAPRRVDAHWLALEEANRLLRNAQLRGGDLRWLRGRLVDVLVTPLDEADDCHNALVVTVAPRHPDTVRVAGARVELIHDDGQVDQGALDAAGHVRLPQPTGAYELSLPLPRETSGETPLVVLPDRVPEQIDVEPLGRLEVTRRRWFGPAAAIAAVLALVLGSVALLRGAGSAAYATVRLSPVDCANTKGRSNDNHVVVAAVWADEEKKRFGEVLERFREKTNIEVTFATESPRPDRNLATTLDKFFEKDCPPDVAMLPQPALLHKLAKEKKALPLDDIAGDLIRQNYKESWQELAREGGKSYGVWFKAANKSIIWYDVHAFERAGIREVPKTWDELLQVARRLQDAGMTPFSVGGADGWTLTDWFENVYLQMWGPESYDDLTHHRIPWTDPTVKDALRKLAEIFGRPEWLAGGTSGARATTYEESVKKVFGGARGSKGAMVFEGEFVASTIAETDAKLGEDARYFDFPSINGTTSPVVGGARSEGGAVGGDVAAMLNDTRASREFIRFLASPDAAKPWVQAGGFASPNDMAAPDADPSAPSERPGSLEGSGPVRFDLSDLQKPAFGADEDQGMWPIFRQFLANPRDVDKVSRDLEAAWQRLGGP